MPSYSSTLLKIFLFLFLLSHFTEAQAKHAAYTPQKHISSSQQKKRAANTPRKHISSTQHKKHAVKPRGKHASSVRHKKPVIRQQESASPPAYVQQQNELERNIQIFLNDLRVKGQLSRDEMTGWMAYDINEEKILVNINADQAFQAASMIKPFVALAFFHQVQQGKLAYTPECRRKMEAMIQRSSNDAANWFMRKVGGPSQCEAILRTSTEDF